MNEELEVLLVTATAHVSIITWCCLYVVRHARGLVSELLIIVLPHLLLAFCPSIAPHLLIIFVILITMKWYVIKQEKVERQTPSQPSKISALPASAKLPYLTILRCTTMLSTLICILAVDFKLWFPHRFSKSGRYGASLMDVGVGAMVYTGGLSAGHRLAGGPTSILSILIKCLPLFVLGVGRVLLIEWTGYHTAVSEYGVHWNFFVTLSFLPLILHFGAMLGRGGVSLTCLAALLMSIYQAILSSTHLEAFLLSDDRASDFISQNKEGIFSLIGYAAIYLHAAHLGSLNNPTAKKRELVRTAFVTLALYTLFKAMGLLASRRMANLPYVLWTILFTSIHHLLAIHASTLYTRSCLPRIAVGMSKYQLIIFLLANLLTGAVNLWMNPAKEGAMMTAFVMAVYIGELSCLAFYLASGL